MRGTRLNEDMLEEAFGIIPAYAGNTVAWDDSYKDVVDHPRVCGEHDLFGKRQWRVKGSSPRMRGTQAKAYDPNDTNGIIPAYAGNTQ